MCIYMYICVYGYGHYLFPEKWGLPEEGGRPSSGKPGGSSINTSV
jgi:hypothetical protein